MITGVRPDRAQRLGLGVERLAEIPMCLRRADPGGHYWRTGLGLTA